MFSWLITQSFPQQERACGFVILRFVMQYFGNFKLNVSRRFPWSLWYASFRPLINGIQKKKYFAVLQYHSFAHSCLKLTPFSLCDEIVNDCLQIILFHSIFNNYGYFGIQSWANAVLVFHPFFSWRGIVLLPIFFWAPQSPSSFKWKIYDKPDESE